MMACRRLAREAVAASLRRGAATAPTASTRVFSSSSSATAAAAAAASCSSRAPVAASPIRHFLARYSSPAFQPRAAEFGPSLAARVVAFGLRPQLSGLNLIKGFGTSAMLAMTLHQGQVTAATKDEPSKAIAGPPRGSLKTEPRPSFWPLVRKLQLPVGLVFLILAGLHSPLGLAVNVLLLIYCSRPSHYSIYLFLQELRHREMGHHAVLKEEYMRTRNVNTEDYKFFSIGTVELADGRVLHLIGILGSWWIYRVSFKWKELM